MERVWNLVPEDSGLGHTGTPHQQTSPSGPWPVPRGLRGSADGTVGWCAAYNWLAG